MQRIVSSPKRYCNCDVVTLNFHFMFKAANFFLDEHDFFFFPNKNICLFLGYYFALVYCVLLCIVVVV